MPIYSYIAKSLKGEEKSGTLEVKDKHYLAKILKKQGFILIRAERQDKKEKKKISEISIPLFSGVSLTEKIMFTRNLQVMVGAGLSLPRALETLTLQAKNKKFKKALSGIKEEIIKGKNFSDALKNYPDIFSGLFQNMIKVGEESGTLDEVLKILTRQMERENELKSKIKGAILYPAVIISAMIGIGILMLIVVIPNLAKTFEELEMDLPVTTKFVIGIGTFLSEKWFLAVLIVAIFLLIFWRISKIPKAKKTIDAFTLKLPIFSPLIKKTNSTYTVRTLSSLIASGVPIVRSLEIVAGTLGNTLFKEAIIEAKEKVRKGEKLSDALAPYENIYPIIIIQMIKVGEETGETSNMLAKLADFFEEEVANATKNLTAIIEPVLMVVIGAAVGFFAISMIQPMYSMLGAL